jgi:hypothetical protein
MDKIPTYVKLTTGNLTKASPSLKMQVGVSAAKISPIDSNSFLDVARLLIACFCSHPRRVLQEIQHTGEKGVEEAVINLFQKTLSVAQEGGKKGKNLRVWRGTVGEVLATAYVIGFKAHAVPVFKLRFAPNLRVAMPGDDVLGFRFTNAGKPLSLLVVEAKNWKDNALGAVKAANATLLRVQNSSPTLLNFVVEVLDAEGRHDEAKMVEQFFDKYNNEYSTEYLAFVAADSDLCSDDVYHAADANPAKPLEIAVFAMPAWEQFQKSLTLPDQEAFGSSMASKKTGELDNVQKLLDNLTFKNEHSRLASAALASSLQLEQRDTIKYDLDAARLEMAARLVGNAAVRLLPVDRKRGESLLYYAARILERLAVWELERGDKGLAVSAMVDGAVAYSVAGYDANARVLMDGIAAHLGEELGKLPPAERLSLLILSGRLPALEDAVAELLLGSQELNDSGGKMDEEEWAKEMGRSLVRTADLLLAKSFALILHYFRVGRSELASNGAETLTRAARVYSMVGEHRSYHLATILAVYFERLARDSAYALLPQYVGDEADG